MTRAEITESVRHTVAEQFDVGLYDTTKGSGLPPCDFDVVWLDLVEVVMSLEDEFDIELQDVDLDKVQTVGHAIDQLIDLVALKVGVASQ